MFWIYVDGTQAHPLFVAFAEEGRIAWAAERFGQSPLGQ
jgi:hypothetical protein